MSLNNQLTVSAVFSSTPRDAHAAPADRVIPGSVSAQHRLGAFESVSPGRTRCHPGEAHIYHHTLPFIIYLSNTASVLLTDVAACTDKPRRAFAGPGGRVALPSVVTPALPFTVWTVPTLTTDWTQSQDFSWSSRVRCERCEAFRLTLVTSGALETWSAVARSGHRVAQLVCLGALADLVTVVAKGAWKTSWWMEEEEEFT